MARQLHLVLSDLRGLNASDFDDASREANGPERLCRLCEELVELDSVETSAPVMFDLIERLSDVDLGSPGPLVHTLEKWRGRYEKHLVESIARKPTSLTVWMVNRILNGKPVDLAVWLKLLQSIASHPSASEDAKLDAREFLRFQQEA